MIAVIDPNGYLIINESDKNNLFAATKWLESWRKGKSKIVFQTFNSDPSGGFELRDQEIIEKEGDKNE